MTVEIFMLRRCMQQASRILPDLPTTPAQLFARLDELGIAYTTHHHKPVFTVAEGDAVEAAIPGGHSKNLFLKDKKGQLWLVVALGRAVIQLNQLHNIIGAARLSFGSPELLWQTLGVRPGSVTPFALINDTEHKVKLVLQQEIMDHAIVNFHPLLNNMTTSLANTDLLRFFAATGHTPQIVSFSTEATSPLAGENSFS